MRRAADVRSLDALKDAKAALIDFRETVTVALSEAQADVQRTLWWLQNDQTTYWRYEVRRRTEKVNQARSDLYRAQLAAMEPGAPCSDQKRALQKAEQRLREAEQKVVHVKKWSRLIEREMMLYRGQCQGIARVVEAELPKAEGRLEKMMNQLERYVKLAPPTSDDVRTRAGTSTPADTAAPAASDDEAAGPS